VEDKTAPMTAPDRSEQHFRIRGKAGIGNQPLAGPCISPLFYGGNRIVKRAGAASGVQISVVTAKHDNAVPADLLTDPLATQLGSQGLVFGLCAGIRRDPHFRLLS
jgi:hypothetical protein